MRLNYADVANMPAKCRAMFASAGVEIVKVTTEVTNGSPVQLGRAIAFFDEHLDHPAWQALEEAPLATREAVRSAHIRSITAAAVDDQVPNGTTLNLVFGRKPS